MNGRVYDPALGRFLSADPFVQAPDNSQSFNRYSYVLNNPLRYTDPSGYVAETGFGAEDTIYQDNYDNKPMEEVVVTGERLPMPMPDYGVPNFSEIDWDFGSGSSWSFNVSTDWGGAGSDWGYYYMPAAYEPEPWGGQDFSQSQSFNQELHPSEIPNGSYACYNDACYIREIGATPIGDPWQERGPDHNQFVEVHPLGETGKQLGAALQVSRVPLVSAAGFAIENLTTHKLGVFETTLTFQKFDVTYQTVWPRENLIYRNDIRIETRQIGGPEIVGSKPYKYEW